MYSNLIFTRPKRRSLMAASFDASAKLMISTSKLSEMLGTNWPTRSHGDILNPKSIFHGHAPLQPSLPDQAKCDARHAQLHNVACFVRCLRVGQLWLVSRTCQEKPLLPRLSNY